MSVKIDFAKIKFLLIDPNPLAGELLRDIVTMLGANQILWSTKPDQAMKILGTEQVDIIITELETTPMTGFDLVKWIRTDRQSPDHMMPIIMLTARSEMQYASEARDLGCTEFLAKPYSVQSLYTRLVSVIAKPRQFVRVGDYFGPDRRRQRTTYSGTDRRQD
jgi:DNA-binding response OmpR family regulator